MLTYGDDSAACCEDLKVETNLNASGCDEVFTTLVQRQSGFVFRVAFAVLRNVHDAEDVVQEIFLKIYQSRTWIGLRDEKAFLAKATWRLAISRAKRSKFVELAVDSADLARPADINLMEADVESTVHRLMDALPWELRLPLALSAIDEMPSPEIAKTMGIPEGTVRTRLARARKILKQKLNELEVRRA